MICYKVTSIVSTLTKVWSLWEDSTCFNIAHCMLSKAVLGVAAKYLESDVSNFTSHFLILGTKVSSVCINNYSIYYSSPYISYKLVKAQ